MADKMFENNQVSIVGEIVSDFRFSHEVYGEGFYMVDVAVNRLSNYMDYIPLMISGTVDRRQCRLHGRTESFM